MNEKEKMAKLRQRADKFVEEAVSAFDINEFVVSPANIHERVVTVYKGQENERKVRVRYCGLPLEEVGKAKGTKHEQSMEILWKMLAAADPSITLKHVQKMESEVAGDILQAIMGGKAPLLTADSKPSSGGSPTTE